MIEEINTLKTEIHENAVAHGWWEEERIFGDICALIHSELSEALEEYRAGRPNFWYLMEDGTISESIDEWHGEKPEGIAVELADAVIRILDYFGKMGYTYSRIFNFGSLNPDVGTFGDFITCCHSDITQAYCTEGGEVLDTATCLSFCILRIECWCKREGLDLARLIAIKHKYNKTRPYKHGGKRM